MNNDRLRTEEIIAADNNSIAADKLFDGHKVELEEMLLGRELRVKRQHNLLAKADNKDKVLISFTVNTPGPIKVCAASDIVFNYGVNAIEESIGAFDEKEIYENPYGHEAFFVVNGDALDIKKKMCMLEEAEEIGRLLDIDVICLDGNKVGRDEVGLGKRRCLICDKDAAICASIRAHSVKELQEKFTDIVLKFAKHS